MVRGAIWLAAGALCGCVTVDGERRAVRETPLPPTCAPSHPTVSVDPALRDRVRLRFAMTERCTEPVETVYEQQQARKLGEPLRVAISCGAALIGVIPTAALFITKPEIEQAATMNPRGSGGSGTGEVIAWALILPGLALGGGAYLGLGKTEQLPAREEKVRTERQLSRAIVAGGTLTGSPLPAGGRALIDGKLELRFEEAQGLDTALLFLDGVPVELTADATERLSALAACKDAIAGPPLETQPPQAVEWRWKRAELCDRSGWGFADQVRIDLASALEARRRSANR